jgi:hypothetical protein
MNVADLEDALRWSNIRDVPWLEGLNMEFQIFKVKKWRNCLMMQGIWGGYQKN